MKFTLTEKKEGRVFEIIATFPSWQLTKYIWDNIGVIQEAATKEKADLKGIKDLYSAVVEDCFEKWREITNVPVKDRAKIKWRTDNDKLISPIIGAMFGQLVMLSKDVAQVRVETEKNSPTL